MTSRQKAIIRDLNRCTFLPGSYEKRFVRDMATKPDDYELSEKQAAFLDKVHHRYREQIQSHWEAGWEVWNEPEEDPDDIEMNRLAFEALYPEEQEMYCSQCGRYTGHSQHCFYCLDQIHGEEIEQEDEPEN